MAAGADDKGDLYRKIFDDFPALIWRSGLDMKCGYFNNTWLAFTGRSLEEELGDGWVEGVHREDVALCMQTYVEAFERRQPFEMQYRLRNAAGEFRWIRDIGRPFYDTEDAFLGYIGSCYDVTEERETERRLREVNDAKDRFFSVVAHDLVGPMAAIESLTGMLESDYRTYDEAELDTLLHELSKAAGNVRALLDELLSWAQSQLRGVTCYPEDLPLREICEDAVAPLLESSRIKDVLFAMELSPAILVHADANMCIIKIKKESNEEKIK